MKCKKCRGLLSREVFIDEYGDSFSGQRCVGCGDITDRIILLNRKGGPHENRRKQKKRRAAELASRKTENRPPCNPDGL